MATKKIVKKIVEKKTDNVVLDMPGTVGSAKLVFAETTVVKGSHLTVTTHPDGKTTLEWDDEALLRDVREAFESAELAAMKPNVRAKVITQRKKKEK